MERYYVMSSEGKIIGTVDGIDGDICWQLAQLNPGAFQLKRR